MILGNNLAFYLLFVGHVTIANISEFRCAKPGLNEYLCTTVCNNDGTCETDITMKKCSCTGEDLYIQKSVMYNRSSGAQVSPLSKSQNVAELCRNCVSYCQQQDHHKVFIDEWKPWVVNCKERKLRGKR